MKYSILIIFCFLLSDLQVKAQTFLYKPEAFDTTSIKYFPTKVGNIYVYLTESTTSPSYRTRAVITKDTMITGHIYYYCQNFSFSGNGWYRVDSATANLYMHQINPSCPHHGNDVLIDSLAMRSGTYNKCGLNLQCFEQPLNLFGSQTSMLSFSWGIGGYSGSDSYAKNFGYYRRTGHGIYNSSSTTLLGCVLNGVLYGDTNYFTGVNIVSTEIPDGFKLYQNSPNPFNPATNIKYSVKSNGKSKKAKIELIIYDVTGRKVTTLVNEELNAGTYQTEWDASGFPSGIYFYSLAADGIIFDTKKMMLLK